MPQYQFKILFIQEQKFSQRSQQTEIIYSLQKKDYKSHIFCLGYGDTFNDSPAGHLFYAEDKPVTSPHGSSYTYGAAGFDDYAYLKRKAHSEYTRKNYLRDLKDLILDIRADVILAVDLDFHADHRMLSLSFETVMGEILSRPSSDYTPEVFKRFAYSTAYMAVPDFFADNLIETRKPFHDETKKTIIDISCYSWNKRVRFPVPEQSRSTVLSRNRTAKALEQHASQYALIKSLSIINSDEVFFTRRTDSLTFCANVSSSSGDASFVHDFRLLNVTDIDSPSPEWKNYLWIPDKNDTAKKLTFTWPEEHSISRVVLWRNIDGTPIQKMLLTMNNGYSQEISSLPEKGLPMIIDMPVQDGITEVNISVIEQGSHESGLAEVEIFEQKEQDRVVKPFIQITSNDNFIYVYNRKPEEKRIPIEYYCYRVNEPVTWSVRGNGHIENNYLVVDGEGDIILRAQAGEFWCESVIHAVSIEELNSLHDEQRRERKRLKLLNFKKNSCIGLGNILKCLEKRD